MTSLDIEIQSILQFGFDYVRSHIDELDHIFAHLNESHLFTAYGDKEILRIKQWIQDNDVPIVLPWSLNAAKAPQISVHISSAQEDVENAFLADHSGDYERTPIDPRLIVPTFVPASINTVGDEITVPEGVDLSLARPGHIIIDGKQPEGEMYQIVQIYGDTVKFLLTTDSLPFEKREAKITSFINEEIRKRGESYFRESIDIGIHGHGDQNTVLWLYSIVKWILLRFKPEIEKRCMDLSTFSASDFRKDNQFLGENIYSRWIRFTARTRVFWREDPLDQLDTIVTTVEVQEDGDC